MAATILGMAASPCTGVGYMRTAAGGKRRARMCRMSRRAAPVGEVITPIRRGKRGRLRYTRFFKVLDDELVVAARLIETDPTAREDVLTGFRGESHSHISLAKHRAPQLSIPIFHREIPVAGRGDREV
jgi:hypothetical protein